MAHRVTYCDALVWTLSGVMRTSTNGCSSLFKRRPLDICPYYSYITILAPVKDVARRHPKSQEAWPEAEPLGWNNSLRREPRWNAVKRARSKRARAASQDAAVVPSVCRRSASFIIYFVARVSEAKPIVRKLRNRRKRRRKPGPAPDFFKAEPGSSCKSSESRAARDAAPHAIFTTMSGD